jgi:hypothetical protein
MDDNQFDDGYEARTPTFRDNDAALSSIVRDDANTPDEVKHKHDDSAAERFPEQFGLQKENEKVADEVLNNRNAPFTVEDEAQQRAIHTAAAHEGLRTPETEAIMNANPDAFKAPGADAFPASGSAPSEAPSNAAGSGSSTPAPKPTSLEETLSSIRMNGDRQHRLVISGDPVIEKAFYEKLEERGQVYYKGGSPVITLSAAKAIKVLQETVAEHQGAKLAHAMSVELDRDHGGVMGTVNSKLANLPAALARKLEGDGNNGALANAAAAAANYFARRHAIDVVVIGQPDVVSAKMKELGSFASDLERNGHVKAGSVTDADGRLKLSENGPLVLNGTARLTDALREVKAKVNTYNFEQADNHKVLKEIDRKGDGQKLADHRAKVADEASGKTPADRPNEHAEKLAGRIDKGIQSPDLLHVKNGKGQVEALVLLQQSRGLKDPAGDRELQTLPDGARQKAIVQMAALVEKVANKEFGPEHVKTLDQHKADTSSIRQKVDAYIAMEAIRDPSFAEKTQPLLKEMVDRKVLTEQQAETISNKVVLAVAKEAAAEALAPKAPAGPSGALSADSKSTSADASATGTNASTESQRGANSADTKSTSADASTTGTRASTESNSGTNSAETKSASLDATTAGTRATAESNSGANSAETKSASLDATTTGTRATAESNSGANSATDGKSVASESTASLAANASAPSVSSKDARVEPTLGSDVPTAPASKAASEASAPVADKPLELRDRIEAMAKEGPASLTADKAHELVAALDGIRSKPLTALDAGAGSEPTRTLVRTETLLKELETGRFGEELKAQAKDLAEPLQKWEKQDTTRFNNDGSVTTLNRDDVVAGVKTGLSKWDGAPGTAQADVVAPAPAPSKGPAGDAQSTPANPEKASTSASPAVAQEAAAVKPDAAATVKADAAPVVKADAAAEAKVDAPQVTKVEAPVVKADVAQQATPEAAPAAKVEAAQPAKTEAAAEVKAAPVQDPAATAAKEQAAQRLTETESAGAKLSQMMSNPAGSFTNRDKTWNHENVQRAASEVMRLDPDSVAQLSPAQRTKVAVYAAWVAENARDGKLPGFSSEDGKQTATQLVERAATLISKLEDGSKLPADIQKNLDKGDRMLASKAELQNSASHSSEQSNQQSREQQAQGGISPRAADAFAKDLVHAVYRAPELREADVKYLLRNAANLTPAATRDMEPQLRAQTAVAMSHLAQEVKGGAMGDFSKLPSQVQKNVVTASNTAETLLTSMAKDPSMRAELNQAYGDLHAKNAGAAKTAGAASSKTAGAEQASESTKSSSGSTKSESTSADKQSTSAASKSDGRSHDR